MRQLPFKNRLVHPRRTGMRRQGGMVLLAVLVVLGLLLLAGAGAMRSVDSGNVISGNFSFQQAARQAADRALTDAINTTAAAVAGGGGNTNVTNRYFSVRQAGTDSRGFPSTIDWSTVSCVGPNGAVVANCATDTGEYRIQYVIERMCSSNPVLTDITDIRAKCEYEASVDAVAPTSIPVRYRVLTRVRGPRQTTTWFEAMFSGPANS
jgi:Tfp pilus assembly protein PilX